MELEAIKDYLKNFRDLEINKEVMEHIARLKKLQQPMIMILRPKNYGFYNKFTKLLKLI